MQSAENVVQYFSCALFEVPSLLVLISYMKEGKLFLLVCVFSLITATFLFKIFSERNK